VGLAHWARETWIDYKTAYWRFRSGGHIANPSRREFHGDSKRLWRPDLHGARESAASRIDEAGSERRHPSWDRWVSFMERNTNDLP
jgi:hypothetical protein